MKTSKEEKKKEDVVYVGIDDPVSLRRDLLEASKSLVHVLKGQHSLRETRNEKHKLIEQLRGMVTEINVLLDDAKSLLPEAGVDLPPEEKPRKIVVVAAPKVRKPATPPVPSKTEIHVDKFEKELRDIEDKLKSL